MKLPIFLDHHSTTPVDERVLKEMLPYFSEQFGNASSRHHLYGEQALQAVEKARRQIAGILGAADPEEIIFTSGATESNNLALKGIASIYRQKGNHIITTAIEHKSVLDTCKFLETQGFRVTYLSVDSEGLINLNELEEAISPQTILISIMHANNEIGTIQPIREIAKLARARGIFFHSDISQTLGKIPVNVQDMQIDLASFSAHKLYGPKGIGALFVRKQNPRVRLEPLIHGGGHEHGFRSGTLNVAGIVGLAKALEIAKQESAEESKRILNLREKLFKSLNESLDEVRINGSLSQRLPGNLNMSFAYVEGEALLSALTKEIAVSSGSACTSALPEPSYVLKALGVEEEFIHTSIRFGIGRFNTDKEIEQTADYVVRTVRHLRKLSPLYEAHKLEKAV